VTAVTLWMLTNRAGRELACCMTEDPSGALVLVLAIEGEAILRETHYSRPQLIERARGLQSTMSRWEESR
jgi:hypothetical protein